MVRTKESALKFLRSLVDISNKLATLIDEINTRLTEIEELQRDDFIGLALSKDQRDLLNSKNAYAMLKKEIEAMNPNHIENGDDILKTCVESIFLEKKEERKRSVDEKVVAAKEKKKREPRIEEKTVHVDSTEQLNVMEDVYPRARVPYAWKSGSVYEGGSRERKKDHEKKRHPTKEYSGWGESKKTGSNKEHSGWDEKKTSKNKNNE